MRLFLTSVALFLVMLLRAQCPPVVYPNPWAFPLPPNIATISITTFGAVPNDNCSDHEAFRAAAAWINARGGYTKLSIPNGEFIVGKQWTPAPGTGGFVEYSIPFKLVNCTEVELAGTGHPVIRFEDCLKYGRFVMVGGVVHAKVNVACNNSMLNWTEVAEVGAMIHLDNCSKTTIKQLKLDGNINGAIIGGKYNYDGYQIGYDGLIVASCDNIKIANVRVSHFGRDGMMPCSSDAPAMNIAITNSWF